MPTHLSLSSGSVGVAHLESANVSKIGRITALTSQTSKSQLFKKGINITQPVLFDNQNANAGTNLGVEDDQFMTRNGNILINDFLQQQRGN